MFWLLSAVSLLIALVVIGPYMARRIGGAARELAPWLPAPVYRVARWLYYAALYTLPLSMIALLAYAWIRGGWGGAPRSEWLDYLLIYPFWLALLWSGQCALLLVPLDLLHWLVHRLARRRPGLLARRVRAAWVLAIAGVFAVYLPVRIAHDNQSIDVRHVVVRKPGLPAALDGFRIVLIADLQADRYTTERELSRYIQAANREQPDLTLIAGDMITSGPEYVDTAARHAGALAAPYGVYACIGDHDNWLYRPDAARSVRELTQALAARGVQMLDNQVVSIPVGEARLAVMLVTDNYVTRVSEPRLDELMDAARGADFQIALSHQPSERLVDWARRGGVELFLAGHTHGGQAAFWFPFVDIHPTRLEGRYVRGSFLEGGMRIIVSSGLGVSVVPFRYRSTPTIDVIELAAE